MSLTLDYGPANRCGKINCMRPTRHASLGILFLFAIVLLAPSEASAHGEAGITFSATTTAKNGTVRYVDVDYSETSIVARDSVGRFTFDLFTDASRTQFVDYTDIWVRIVQDIGSKNEKTVFAGPIYSAKFGVPGFLFTFPESGAYTLYVRYNDATIGSFGESLAEAEYPLDVLRSLDENSLNVDSIEFVVGVASGALAVLLGLLPMILGRRKV